MKLSFYAKKHHPSSYRLMSQVSSYFVLLWLFSIPISMVVGFAMFFSPVIVYGVFSIAAFIAVLCIWRKDRPRGTQVFARIAVFSILYLVLCLVIATFAREGAIVLSAGYGFAVFLGMWPYDKYPPIKDPDDESYTFEYPVLTREVARFQMLPLLKMFSLVLVSALSIGEMDSNDVHPEVLIMLLAVAVAGVWLAFWRRGAFRSGQSIVIVCIAAIVSIAGAVVAYSFAFGPYQDIPSIGSVAFLLLFVMISSLAFRRTNAEALQYHKDMLKRAKVEYTLYCPVCSYNMSGSTKLCCPECGTEYALGRLIEENEYLRNPDLWLN